MEDIGQRIKMIRKKNNKTQKELGELIDLKPSTITLMEQGKSKLTIESLIIICKEYNVSADWILFGKEAKEELQINYNRLNPEQKRMVNMLFEEAKEREKETLKIGNL